jgi:hypothetical protein
VGVNDRIDRVESGIDNRADSLALSPLRINVAGLSESGIDTYLDRAHDCLADKLRSAE